jgi:suppressor of ftsI
MTNGDEVSITCGEAASIVDRIRGFVEHSDLHAGADLAPDGLLPLVTDSLPVRLLPTEILAGTPIRSRDITLGDDPGINGQLWDPQRIDITAQQGTWERWTVRADRPQSFHIEGVMFQSVTSTAPRRSRKIAAGRIPSGSTGGELLVYYAQPSWPHFPFQYLSQTLELADRFDWPDAGESGAVISSVPVPCGQGLEKPPSFLLSFRLIIAALLIIFLSFPRKQYERNIPDPTGS